MTDFHFHDLRHTCATRMVQAGVDLYKVQRLLGHNSPIMTQRYAHHYPESLRDGIEVLDGGRVVSTNLAQLRVVSEHGPASVEKLVPPIRIERTTTNGLGISYTGIAGVLDRSGNPHSLCRCSASSLFVSLCCSLPSFSLICSQRNTVITPGEKRFPRRVLRR